MDKRTLIKWIIALFLAMILSIFIVELDRSSWSLEKNILRLSSFRASHNRSEDVESKSRKVQYGSEKIRYFAQGFVGLNTIDSGRIKEVGIIDGTIKNNEKQIIEVLSWHENDTLNDHKTYKINEDSVLSVSIQKLLLVDDTAEIIGGSELEEVVGIVTKEGIEPAKIVDGSMIFESGKTYVLYAGGDKNIQFHNDNQGNFLTAYQGNLYFFYVEKQYAITYGEIMYNNTSLGSFDTNQSLRGNKDINVGKFRLYPGVGYTIKLNTLRDKSIKKLSLYENFQGDQRISDTLIEERDIKDFGLGGEVDDLGDSEFTVVDEIQGAEIQIEEIQEVEIQGDALPQDIVEVGSDIAVINEIISQLELQASEPSSRLQEYVRNNDRQENPGNYKIVQGGASIEEGVDGDQNIALTLPKKNGRYFLIFEDDAGYIYSLEISNDDAMKFRVEDYPDYVEMSLWHAYPIDIPSLTLELDRFFGKGRYSLNESSLMTSIVYYLNPNERVSGSINVTNIFGVTESVAIDINQKDIPKAFTQAVLQGGALNILPQGGYRGDKIEVTHKNMPTFSLTFQACEYAVPNFEENNGMSLDSYLFDCSGDKITREYDYSDTYEWWNVYDSTIELPESIRGNEMFRVWFDDDKEAKYFVQAGLGLFAKTTTDTLYLRGFEFDTGNNVRAGTIEFFNSDFEKIDSFPYQPTYDLQALREKVNPDGLMMIKFTSLDGDQSFMTLSVDRGGWFYYSDYDNNIYKNLEIQSYLDTYDLYKQRGRRGRRGDATPEKIYGYTDRALYRPGDVIYYSGFVRDLLTNNLPTGEILVTLFDADGSEIGRKELTTLDEFGGFKGSFDLSEDVSLGFWYIEFSFNENSYYSQSLKVEEFQKPTFYVDVEASKQGDNLVASVDPQYYFGAPLKSYDLTVDWSLSEESVNYWSWWDNNNDDPYYYNYRFDSNYLDSGSIGFTGVDGKLDLIELTSLGNITSQGVNLVLQGTAQVKDLLSDEVQTISFSETIEPKAIIGLEGYPYDWVYEKNSDSYSVSGKVNQKPEGSEIKYQWYFRSYYSSYEWGVDRNRYYVNGNSYTPLGKEGSLEGSTFTLRPVLDEPGDYFLRVWVEDGDTILGEVQKEVNYYDWSYRGNQQSSMGRVVNNYELALNIEQKPYAVGEDMIVNIEPYVQGASAIVTVERGNNILDTYEVLLEGNPVSIKAKQSYVPNVSISVFMMVGENQNLGGEKRKEPRFFVGYGEAQIDKKAVTLNIDVKTDKEQYEPGDRVEMTIVTTDDAGNKIDARLSIGVIDKALTALYDLIKEPIPHMYNTIGSYVGNYTNLRLLYQSLKVFTADGSKGGGGGDGGFADFALRETFVDLAYWRGGEITKDGTLTVSTQIPDNLTTWIVDIIGITKDGKLGTVRKEFSVTKPLLIEPNLPLFLTLGDSIQMPIKVVSTSDRVGNNAEVIIDGQLETTSGEIFELGSLTTVPNKQALFTISVPDGVYGDELLTIRFKAKSGKFTDGFEREIPLRTSGFINKDFLFSGSMQGEKLFDFEGLASFATIQASVSRLPIDALSKAFKYLLHFPYGCTEQLMSSLYPIATVIELSDRGYLGNSYIREGKINLGNQDWNEIGSVISSGFDKIFKHQQSDGGMAYWSEGESVYQLSAYVYGAMRMYKDLGYAVHDDHIERLDNYLQSNGGVQNPKEYLYYLWNRGVSESVETSFADQVQKTDGTVRLLSFALYAQQGEIAKAMSLYKTINANNLGGGEGGYGVYLNNDVMKAIWMRGLIDILKNEGTTNTISSDEKEILERAVQNQLIDFLGSRDASGLWTWSTQTNVQILLALGDYLTRKQKNDNSVSCTITIGEETKTFLIDTSTILQEMVSDIENSESVELSWSCDDDILIDVSSERLLQDYSTIESSLENMRELSFDLSELETASIGDVVTMKGSFSVDKEASNVAVEFFIPSTVKLLGAIQGGGSTQGSQRNRGYWDGSDSVNKTYDITTGSWECRPSHVEVRFDRLFMYFDSLQSGQTCGYDIKGLKAYAGEVNIMPTRLREMYQTTVFGRYVHENAQ